MTLTFDWCRPDDTTAVAIRVTFTPGWSTPAVTWRSPDRCHEAGGEAPEVEGFACGDERALTEFQAEYNSVPDLRELVAAECEREGAAQAEDVDLGRAEWLMD